MKHSRIYRVGPSDDNATTALSAAPPDSNGDELHENLFDLLRSAFHTHPRRGIGGFDDAAEQPALAAALADYRQQGDAQQLGQRLAEALRRALEGVEPRQNWYFWVVVEQSGDDELIYLFLFQQDENHFIDAQLTLAAGRSVVPGKLQYAAKVQLTEFGQRSSTCLSWLAPKNKQPVTLAWNVFVGFSEGVDRAAQTEQLLGVVERYADALPPEREEEYRARVVDYCMEQNRRGEPVAMAELSRHVDEEQPDALLAFFTEQAEAPAPALYTDRNQLKRYTRLYGRDQDLSISFSTAMLGRHVLYDPASGTLTIRAVPPSLKAQLARHSDKRGKS